MISLNSFLPILSGQSGGLPSSSGANAFDNALAASGGEEDLWWPPNQGIFIGGEQKLTHEALTQDLAEQEQVDPEKAKELKSACNQFESFFLYYLLKVMDKTVPRGEGVLGDSLAQRFYREMFYEDLADKISESGMGLGQFMYSQLSQGLLNQVYK